MTGDAAGRETGLPAGYVVRPEWEVTAPELRRLLEGGGGVVVLDVRTPGEFELARLEGSRLVPLQELAARIGELESLRGERVVTMCHHGVRSLRAAAFLRERGFAEVRSLAGGIDAWSRAVDPAVPRY